MTAITALNKLKGIWREMKAWMLVHWELHNRCPIAVADLPELSGLAAGKSLTSFYRNRFPRRLYAVLVRSTAMLCGPRNRFLGRIEQFVLRARNVVEDVVAFAAIWERAADPVFHGSIMNVLDWQGNKRKYRFSDHIALGGYYA